jgi:hypothetical protein
LDFHNSPAIPGIGEKFEKTHWQETLQKAHVDSITCFSSCHHGWSYHPTHVGTQHPGLSFNLLRRQIEACHEIGVKVPVYLSGALNNLAAYHHPEWREITVDGGYPAWWSSSPLSPSFHKLCFNTPYLDYLCLMLNEVLAMFPDADGIFIDIIIQGECCCRWCLEDMIKEGYDPGKEDDRRRFSKRTLDKYYKRIFDVIHGATPTLPIFHNSGHLEIGNTAILNYFSHLELESLPTGGWGYDHYPLSASYARKLGLDFLGMTGKFHTSWGEFGGFKHPNALRYECALMLAQGSKCSIGDQLHPGGRLDESTYEMIGQAYAEVEQKEAWCVDVQSAATVALLSNTAFKTPSAVNSRSPISETGALRILLESHIPFDTLDPEMPFDNYKILILADDMRIAPEFKARLDKYLAAGGKIILSGTSGLWADRDEFAFAFGCDYFGASEFCPDYVQAAPRFAPDFVKTPFVMYLAAQRIKTTRAQSLGDIFDPYFNRDYQHFSSHQHTPYKPESSGFDAGAMAPQILYFAHPVFSIYTNYGNVALKQFVYNAIAAFAGKELPIRTTLPSQGRVTLMRQLKERRYILHLLYANPVKRGTRFKMDNGYFREPIEVIEDLNPLVDVCAGINVPETIRKVTLEPQGMELPATRSEDGYQTVTLGTMICHQILVFHY